MLKKCFKNAILSLFHVCIWRQKKIQLRAVNPRSRADVIVALCCIFWLENTRVVHSTPKESIHFMYHQACTQKVYVGLDPMYFSPVFWVLIWKQSVFVLMELSVSLLIMYIYRNQDDQVSTELPKFNLGYISLSLIDLVFTWSRSQYWLRDQVQSSMSSTATEVIPETLDLVPENHLFVCFFLCV